MEQERLTYEQIDKIRKAVNQLKSRLDKTAIENLQLSIIEKFPEVSFYEGSEMMFNSGD